MLVDPDMPLPRQSGRRRLAFSSPAACLYTDPPSPTDSGYGSAEPSPVSSDPFTPQASEYLQRQLPNELWMLGDGNRSEDVEEDSPDPAETEETTRFEYLEECPSPTIGVAARRRAYVAKKSKPHTLPTRSAPHSRPRLPDSFVSESGTKLPRRRSNTGLVRSRTRSLRAYDRFIPLRTQSAETTARYKTGKEWNELTASERLLRHNGATEDAFCYRRGPVTPMARDYRVLSRSDSVTSQRVGNVLGPLDQNTGNGSERQVSRGTIWAVGGLAPGGTAVDNGRGQLVTSRTNARLFRTMFRRLNSRREEGTEKHEARLATALGLDRAQRTLDTKVPSYIAAQHPQLKQDIPTQWNGAEWVKDTSNLNKSVESRTLPAAPFKVLDAPALRDDFYCSILAYSPTCKMLAVGLGDVLYGWSESGGVKLLNEGNFSLNDDHLTSIDFSSTRGGKAILAYGRSNRSVGLMSLLDDRGSPPTAGSSRTPPIPRFEVVQPAAVTCLSWKPTPTSRPSKCPMTPGRLVETEDLLVGDDTGRVWYYAVEWPYKWEVDRDNWSGAITLLLCISVHKQQVCGLAWSPSGDLFATGGNDNLCCLYDTAEALSQDQYTVRNELFDNQDELFVRIRTRTRFGLSEPEEGLGREGMGRSDPPNTIGTIQRPQKSLIAGDEKHLWKHSAAVKAIAFCPWQEGLVATGGGSNDKCIHFYHTTSGAALATISVSAQVTSLIWSKTKREICATFGYAQPEHPVRIAVFSWPDCRQVAAIPWGGEHRALYAIPYPGGPDELRAAKHGAQPRSSSRTAMEGCIMVASSDKSVKFHEVWASDKKAIAGGAGMLGGSDILEGLEGIDKEGDIIR